ncbi:MAG: acyltransferase [Acidimicrobiales bacterium]
MRRARLNLSDRSDRVNPGPSGPSPAFAALQTQTPPPADLEEPPLAAEPPQPVRIPYAPGLDGLRGIAVAVVLVFHAAPPTWLPGGFLGVSLFFTLSGYLITTLVLGEVRRDRHVDLWAFWARRMRRLVPALVASVIGVMLLAWLVDLHRGIHDDLIGALTYTSNWVQVIKGQSYGDLFLAPSPLTHLWSLAIEEQFYLVLPVVTWLLVRRGPWQVRSKLGVGAVVVIVVGFAVAVASADPVQGYYSTVQRAPEIAMGVLLACVTHVSVKPVRTWLTVAAFAALAAAAVACRVVHVTDPIVTNGGLVAFAVLSATLVRAASRPGPVSSLLSIAPLRWLGLISYGLYVYHWPIVVLLDDRRTSLGPVALFAARMVVAIAIAVASYFWLERPMRHGRKDLSTRKVVAFGVAALLATLAVVVVAVPPDADGVPKAKPAAAVVNPATTRPKVANGPVGPPVVAMLGDSVPAWMIRDGASALDPKEVALVNGTLPACDGAEGTPEARSRTGALVPIPEGCTGWKTQYPPFFRQKADVAALMVGGHAALDREIEGQFRSPCDPVNVDWYRKDVERRLRYLHFHAATVVVVLPAWADDRSAWIYPPDHRHRMDCVRTTLRKAAAATHTATVDFGQYVCPTGPKACRPLRTRDGMHMDPPNAPAALQWLIDQVLAVKED